VNLEVAREETVQILCQQYAQDRLTTSELESRLEQVYKAQTMPELFALTAGLVPVTVSPTTDAKLYASADPSVLLPQERRIAVFFSEKVLDGDWELARRTVVRAIMGSATLDLREARIPAGVTELEINATLAEVKIIVPPGIRIECEGDAFMGSFIVKRSGFAVADDDAPTIRITGNAFLGEVAVKTRLPNENALAALKREWLK
jgi:hypothetical protein